MGGPPRLIDLSVARTLEDAARLRAPIGTDAYMAPEQRDPDGRIGPPADVFGLAAHAVHRADRPPEPPDLRAGCRAARRRSCADVLHAGLDPDPASRPAAAELASALEPLVAALPRRMTLGRRS